jgi:hypothetical protein
MIALRKGANLVYLKTQFRFLQEVRHITKETVRDWTNILEHSSLQLMLPIISHLTLQSNVLGATDICV